MLMDISIDIESINIESIDVEEDDTVSIGMLLPEPIDMLLKGSCGSLATMGSNPNPGPA